MWFLTEDRDDPRHRVTETGFRVERELLGRPLAHPLRRLAATSVDLAVVGTLVLSHTISLWLFALVAAWLLWRVADPDADVRLPSEWLRTLFRGAAVVTAGTAVLVMVLGMFSGEEDGEPAASGPRSAGISARTATPDSADATDSRARDRAAIRELAAVGSDSALRERAAGMALRMYRAGRPRDEVRDEIEDHLSDAAGEDPDWDAAPESVTEGVMSRLDSVASRRAAARDSLLGALAGASDSAPPERIRSLAARLLGTPPRPGVRQLEGRIDRLESELEAARQPPSVVDVLWGGLNDLGLGLGWLGVYFTASLALWRGRTPGKRLLGIRVARIDGDPITTWDAFSRFGGYAASVLTGLLGFAQLLWDPNRQALHDRIAGTVVVREPSGPDQSSRSPVSPGDSDGTPKTSSSSPPP